MATEKHTIQVMMNAENAIEWIFANPVHAKGTKYKYWRLYGLGGVTVSGYISLLFMNVQ